MYKYEEIKDEKAVLSIFHDEDAESPREWDNLGTMVCWHSRYSLGDQHHYTDKDDFLFRLLEEAVGDTDRAERVCENIKNSIDREVHRSYRAYNEAVDEEILAVIEQKFIILPLYLYDHSGITMNTTGFSCPWDSGQVGWIYVSKEKVRKEYEVKRITKKIRDRVIAVLKSEVKIYSQWLEGNVFGFVLKDAEDNEIDSCWGFYGDDWKENGLIEQLPTEYRYLLEKTV